MPKLTIDKTEADQRLDSYLRRLFVNMPKSHIYKLLRTRKVRVNGKRSGPKTVLVAGDQIIIHISEEQFKVDTKRKKGKALNWDFKVMHEDNDILVVSKPAGLAVHSGAGHLDNSLIDQVHSYLGLTDQPASFRPSLAHRLDKDTSGLIMVGKTLEALRSLSKMLKEGKVTKNYLAICLGTPVPKKGSFEMKVIRQDVKGKAKHQPTRRNSKPGKTNYRVVTSRVIKQSKQKRFEVSLLSLHLLTGKTHQIRSHLLQAGHPIAGDRRYGDRDFNRMLFDLFSLKRQFLHAFRLELTHPTKDKNLRFTDGYPHDLQIMAKEMRLGIPE